MGVGTQAGRQAGSLRKGTPVQREDQGRLPAREVGPGGTVAPEQSHPTAHGLPRMRATGLLPGSPGKEGS